MELGMDISAINAETPHAEKVRITEDTLSVDLSDGRRIAVPLAWYPRLEQGSPQERNNWRLIRNGIGIHWEDLDEDISVEGLVAGKPSGESPASFKRWLESRHTRKTSCKMSHKSGATKNISRNPDEAPELTDDWFEKADLMQGEKLVRRGRPAGQTKASQTVRFDLDVLAAFKSTGKGWQTRMNNALREWLKEHPLKQS